MQYAEMQNASPELYWLTHSLCCTASAERRLVDSGEEVGVPQNESWGYWHTDKVCVVFTAVLSLELPQIIRDCLP